MPGRYFGRRRGARSSLGTIVDSNKNSVSLLVAGAAAATVATDLVIAVDAAANTSAKEVTRGCKIKAIWLEFTVRQSADVAVGISTLFEAYLMKNPGDNLTPPSPSSTGTSNEKKFIFREWKSFLGSQTQGSNPYSFSRWIKIPRLYQRFGADDTLQFVFKMTGVAGVYCMRAIYKWYK